MIDFSVTVETVEELHDQLRKMLSGVSTGAVARGSTAAEAATKSAPSPVAGEAEAAPAPGPVETGSASIPAGEMDAAGWPWDETLHASTKSKTKEGLWRMKVGVSRPEPKPGFPVATGEATGTSTETGAPSATSPAATAAAPAPAATSGDDDEFAAFRNALDKDKAADAAAAASAPARKWTDADLGALCNQAAVKLGDPAPVKALITKHVPDGTVPHSRNIPDDKRADFAKAVETAAGIEFAG